MGDPKKSKKRYARPNRPWDKERIDSEKKIKQTYGLRRKREIWKAETLLSDYRRRARELIANFDEEKSKILLNKLSSRGLLDKTATIDDVLDLKAEKLLDRRLQTIIVKAKLANTPKQARQFIVHGHIKINNQKIKTPSYIVKINEEKDISFASNSSLQKIFVPVEDKTETKTEKKEVSTPKKAETKVEDVKKEEVKIKNTETKNTKDVINDIKADPVIKEEITAVK
ncbi:30S ribosomal protein S4 [archaeon]|nr:30S ribosomal protein S4 [archaeon]